jgi:hypothetical protein
VSVSRRKPPFVVFVDYEEPTPPSLRSRRSYSSSETRPDRELQYLDYPLRVGSGGGSARPAPTTTCGT